MSVDRMLARAVVAALVTWCLAAPGGPAQAVPPATPGAPSVSVSGDVGTISWVPVPGAVDYVAEYTVDGGALWLHAAPPDPGTTSTDAISLRAKRALGCQQDACQFVARVSAINADGEESDWSPLSAPAVVPVPYSLPLHVARAAGRHRVTLLLYGTMPRAGVEVRLQRFVDGQFVDTGRSTRTRRQTLPAAAGKRTRRAVAYVLRVVVTARGRSTFRVEVPAEGIDGEGTSRPYGVEVR